MVRDRRIIFTASFLRAVANGLIGVLAGIYLAQLGLDPAAWGAVTGARSAGPALGAAGGSGWYDLNGTKGSVYVLGSAAAAGGMALAVRAPLLLPGVAAVL